MTLLKFSPVKDNAKLSWMGKHAYSLSLLSGVTCPGSDCCKSQVVETPEGRRIKDGPNAEFRCWSASQELIFKSLYLQRKHNTEAFIGTANSKELTVQMIEESLPKDAKIIRLYVAGDVQNQRIFDSWLEVTKNHPDIRFYSYTKSLPFWVRRLDNVPENWILTASVGGKFDSLIKPNKLRFVKVVSSEYEARKLKLPVDTDDRYASLPKFRHTNFSLVIHGQQPKGSALAKNWKEQIDGKRKFHGYSSNSTFGKYYKENYNVNKS